MRVRIQTADGRLAVESSEPVPDLPIGHQVSATGTLRDPQPWEAGYLARYGIRQVLAADRLRLTGRRRAGPAALIDRIRDRAEVALESGTPEAEAALLRGFVLGEDDRIEAATVDDFKRSGLAHLLAVSGQNVILLALLAVPLLALLGVPVRARLLCVLALIAIYVPGHRRRSLDPARRRDGCGGDRGRARRAAALALVRDPARRLRHPGDQPAGERRPRLATQLRRRDRDPALGGTDSRLPPRAASERARSRAGRRLAARPRRGRRGDDRRDALHGPADGARLRHGVARLPAREPARAARGGAADVAGDAGRARRPAALAPGGAADRPRRPARRLRRPGRPLARPRRDGRRASVPLAEPSRGAGRVRRARPGALGAARLGAPPAGPGKAAGSPQAPRLGDLPRGLRPRPRRPAGGRAGPPPSPRPGCAWSCWTSARATRSCSTRPTASRCSWTAARRAPICAAGSRTRESRASRRRSSPTTSRITPAGSGSCSARSPSTGCSTGSAARDLIRECPLGRRPGDGDRRGVGDRFGQPPDRGAVAAAGAAGGASAGRPEPGRRWSSSLAGGASTCCSTADAEAEAVPIDPGPVDVLKVAHHGSEDAGLDGLLDRSAPRLAVISVGADNPYGHPSAATLATLAEHRVAALRTDETGEVTIDVRRAWLAGRNRRLAGELTHRRTRGARSRYRNTLEASSLGQGRASVGWRLAGILLAPVLAFGCAVMLVAMSDIGGTPTCQDVSAGRRASVRRRMLQRLLPAEGDHPRPRLAERRAGGRGRTVRAALRDHGRQGRLALQLAAAALVLGGMSILIGSV